MAEAQQRSPDSTTHSLKGEISLVGLVSLDRKIGVIGTHYKGNQTDQSQIKAGHFVNQNPKENAQRRNAQFGYLPNTIRSQALLLAT